jgi:hypothetical protein
VNTYLNALRSLGVQLNPPARQRDLAHLEQALGFELLADLRTLYKDHDGLRECARLPMRMMSATEAAGTHRAVCNNFPDLLDRGAVLLWTDDNSNYGGVFLAEPLRGRLFLLDHDSPNDAPRFRSVESFCRSLLAAAGRDQPWVEMETDYPRLADPPVTEKDEDRANATACLRRLDTAQSELEYSRLAHRALSLLPPCDFALVLPLLSSADTWVQERACEVLGLWRCAEAVPDLLRVGRTGMHNGQVAAVHALHRIATADARRAVRMLQSELGPGFEWLFRGGAH